MQRLLTIKYQTIPSILNFATKKDLEQAQKPIQGPLFYCKKQAKSALHLYCHFIQCHGANLIILQKAIFFIVPVFSLQPLPTTSAHHFFSSFSFLFQSQSNMVLGIVFGLFSALLGIGLLLTALFEAIKKEPQTGLS